MTQRSRTAIVTGGLSGMGLAIARRLIAEGHDVTIGARRGGDAEAVREILGTEGIGAHVAALDVRSTESVDRFVAEVVARRGGVDILVNAAGVYVEAPVTGHPDAAWDDQIDTNLSGVFNCSRAVIESMRERSFGRIVNIGSINGQAGQYGQVNYAATKSGIHGFTKALAQEGAAKNITVNAIAPGYVDTDMVRAVPPDVLEKIVARIPVGRLGKADDIARGVLFLTADNADFITGSTLSINGGQHMY